MTRFLPLFLSAVTLCCFLSISTAISPVEVYGGSGHFTELLILNCSLAPCFLSNNTRYDSSIEFVSTTNIAEVTLQVSVRLPEMEYVIMEASVPGSSLSPGEGYRIRFGITPNSILVGGKFDLEVEILDSSNYDKIVCVRAPIEVVRT